MARGRRLYCASVVPVRGDLVVTGCLNPQSCCPGDGDRAAGSAASWREARETLKLAPAVDTWLQADIGPKASIRAAGSPYGFEARFQRCGCVSPKYGRRPAPSRQQRAHSAPAPPFQEHGRRAAQADCGDEGTILTHVRTRECVLVPCGHVLRDNLFCCRGQRPGPREALRLPTRLQHRRRPAKREAVRGDEARCRVSGGLFRAILCTGALGESVGDGAAAFDQRGSSTAMARVTPHRRRPRPGRWRRDAPGGGRASCARSGSADHARTPPLECAVGSGTAHPYGTATSPGPLICKSSPVRRSRPHHPGLAGRPA